LELPIGGRDENKFTRNSTRMKNKSVDKIIVYSMAKPSLLLRVNLIDSLIYSHI